MRKLPSKEELHKAAAKRIGDIIEPNLKVLFCGINPGLYSAYSGYHFGRPGNRFWKALFLSGFTNRLLHPSEQRELLGYKFGITNIVDRASVSAKELTVEEYIEGGKQLRLKIEKFRPQWVAFVGVEAYRKAFGRPKANKGKQDELISKTNVWVLPSPSGLNAHYNLQDLANLFKELRLSL